MARRRRDGFATVEIPRSFFDTLTKEFPELEEYRPEYRHTDEVPLPIRHLQQSHLVRIVEIFRGAGLPHSAGHVQAFLNVLDAGNEATVPNLKMAETAIIAWVVRDAIRGWVFRVDDEMPMLVTDVEYHNREDNYPAHVRVSFSYIAKNENRGHSFILHAIDLKKKTVSKIMAEQGFVHEDPGLIAAFDATERRYLERRDLLGKEFLHESGRVVNDTTGPTEKVETEWGSESSKPNGKDLRYRERNDVFRKAGEDDDDPNVAEVQFTRVPVRPYLFCFNLKTHSFDWLLSTELRSCTYNPGIKARLVLPSEHHDLIDALTKDLCVVAEDIVENKSGGITILCQGKPGTGKTLTAEVYAEVVGRPLYRVHSGQLGTEPAGLEKILVQALERAARWDAVLLIDEADVFLMQRTDDLTRNAVVGVFLRTLEYYRGVLFLTTNRLDAIDDAIVSRCIAVIQYKTPGVAERLAIWQTQLDLNGLELNADLVQSLAETFEATGRDIKGLVRLVSRYCSAKSITPTMEEFRKMAMFRGVQ